MQVFHRRIYLGVLAMILSFVPIVVTTFVALQSIVTEQRSVISLNAKQVFMAERLNYLNSTQAAIMPIYRLSGNAALLEHIFAHYREFFGLLNELIASEKDLESAEVLRRIRQLSSKLALIEDSEAKRKFKALDSRFVSSLEIITNQLVDLLKDLTSKETRELESADRHFTQTIDWAIDILVFSLCATITFVFYVIYKIRQTLKQKQALDESRALLFERERQLSQARKEAVEVVAHDLKNPLGTVKMSVDMMLESLPSEVSPEQMRQTLEIAKRSSRSMERLIEDLLDHAKIESGKLVLDKAPCNLAQLALDLEKVFRPSALKKEIQLVMKVDPFLPSLFCDGDRLEQVLSNLLGNAIKFTPRGGKIEVTIALKGDATLIRVQDSGPGMSSIQIEHAFERFWQVKESAKEGTGLGLAIAKGIVDSHGGKIWIESESGHGACFCVLLPNSSARAERPREAQL